MLSYSLLNASLTITVGSLIPFDTEVGTLKLIQSLICFYKIYVDEPKLNKICRKPKPKLINNPNVHTELISESPTPTSIWRCDQGYVLADFAGVIGKRVGRYMSWFMNNLKLEQISWRLKHFFIVSAGMLGLIIYQKGNAWAYRIY